MHRMQPEQAQTTEAALEHARLSERVAAFHRLCDCCMASKKATVLALVATLACGSSQNTPDPSSDDIVLAPASGWPASVAVRSLPRAFRTSVTSIEIDAVGKVWLLRDTWSESSQLLGAPVLERYAESGHLEKRITFATGAVVPSFVVHPSGELTVLLKRANGGDALDYALEILRLSAEGETISALRFEDT